MPNPSNSTNANGRNGAADPLAVARDLLRRGIMPIPLEPGEKNPTIPRWQHLTIDASNVEQYFNGADLNVGGRMGAKSGGLADVDLDCVEAVKLAPHFLPSTNSIYGRASKRRSHHLYRCSDVEPRGNIPLKDEGKKVLVELRLGGGVKGAQSAMPGSRHDSGELYAWDEAGEPARIAFAELKAATRKLAVAAVFLRHWPEEIGRHDASLGVGGFLARAGWTPDEAHHLVHAVCVEAGGSDWADDNARTAREAAQAFAEGREARGLPWMRETFGTAVADQVAKLAGYRTSDGTVASPEGFEVDQRGNKLKTSQRNIRRAMELLGVEVSYDAFHDVMLISGLEGHSVVSDQAVEKLWLAIDERFRFLPPKDFFFIVVQEAALRDSFHPVCDYLDALTWDGIRRIDRWLATYGGADDTPYARAVGEIALVAAVRRVRKPGCKFDEMLILESSQGKEKSNALAVLTVRPDWFSDDLPLNADGKKVIEQLRGRWIVEAAEMSGMRKADVEHLKALLSRQVDRGRLAYARITTDQPRQSIVIGTTNASIYLKDITGNRRFWPVKIGEFDVKALRRDRDQLWAEASAREAAGVSIRLDPSLWDAAATEQSERTVDDPWRDLLEEVLGDLKGKVVNSDAWKIVNVMEAHRTQDQNLRLGQAMKALGFERKPLRIDGKVTKVYVRGNNIERERRIFVERHKQRVFASLSAETVQNAVQEARNADAEEERF
jgi:predicted P-loop ATPase